MIFSLISFFFVTSLEKQAAYRIVDYTLNLE